MANTRSNSIGPRLTKAEMIAGYLYLPFYLALLSLLLDFGAELLELELTSAQFNLIWFCVNLVLIWIIFRKFLIRSLRAIRFWELVQAVILGYVFLHVGTWLFNLIIGLLDVSITNFNDDAVEQLVTDNRLLMVLCSVVIAPMVEETLVRGLIFGSIRTKSRLAAYAVSIVFFSFMHVWSYIPAQGFLPVLLAALPYIPAGLALGWTYEKANTIWAPIAVHILNNAIMMSLI